MILELTRRLNWMAMQLHVCYKNLS